MYSHQLDTFLTVANAGSFSKAAGELYISSTAVMKQIDRLERDLEIRLFERTPRGLTLTNAGRSYYQDAKYMIQYARDAQTRARNAMQSNDNVIRIGTSIMTPHHLLMELWPRIHQQKPQLKFQIVGFENTPENARKILGHLGQDIDVVAGIFDDTMLSLRGCTGLELNRQPLCCAVSIYHPLAQKDRLTVEDLYGQEFMLMHRDWSDNVDRLRDELWRDHPQIKIRDIPFYNVDVFNQCENNNALLMAVPIWQSVHPLLKIIPVDWDHSMPFGLMHAPEPSPTVRSFLEAVKQIYYGQEQ